MSVSEYFKREAESLEKHEYRDGEMLAMAGNKYNHSLIAANLMGAFGRQLKGKPCKVLDSNLRIGIPKAGVYTYPDASIICGAPKLDPIDPAGVTALNPRVLVEILSPSTEAYDRGTKFTRYRMIETLEDYVLVSQVEARVEVFHHQADGTWVFASFSDRDGRAGVIGLQLDLAEIYDGVAFEEESGSRTNGNR